MATRNTDQNGITTALWAVVVVGILLTIAGPALLGAGTRMSLALGSALAVGNLWLVARTVRGFLNPASGARSSWISLAMLKFGLLFIGVLFLVRGGHAKVLPLAFGYAALPLGIVISQLKSAPAAPGEG
ncbi:MAG TPA: hypothetical protein VHV51_20510 [Polyangiaceae bacterium]|jgi:hypothetical protein|nr:hypothetical protein [Polyangiaceae bacterium]